MKDGLKPCRYHLGIALVPKLQRVIQLLPHNRIRFDGKLELPRLGSQAGAWESAKPAAGSRYFMLSYNGMSG